MTIVETDALYSGYATGAGPGQSPPYLPLNVGDLVIICGRIQHNAATITGITGGGVDTWLKAVDFADATNDTYEYMWYGTCSATDGQTQVSAIVSWDASITGDISMVALSFTAGLGAGCTWVANTWGHITTPAGTGTTGVYPSLTPTADGLYLGFQVSSLAGSPITPANPPYTYETDPNNSTAVCWYAGAQAGQTYEPYGNRGSGASWNTIAAVFAPSTALGWFDSADGTWADQATASGNTPSVAMDVAYTSGASMASGGVAVATYTGQPPGQTWYINPPPLLTRTISAASGMMQPPGQAHARTQGAIQRVYRAPVTLTLAGQTRSRGALILQSVTKTATGAASLGAISAAGHGTVNNAVTVPGGGPTPAAFPSILSTSGRNLVDANGYVVAGPGKILKGFNCQVPPWSQADLQTVHDAGARIIRNVVFWDLLQPSAPSASPNIQTGAGCGVSLTAQGSSSNWVVANLDAQVAAMEAAGLYLWFCFYFSPESTHCPAWVTGGKSSTTATLVNNGQAAVEFLAYRYGNPASPNYSKAVIGFGLNKPRPDALTADHIPHIEGQWRTIISWFRTHAPDWIAVISYAYRGGGTLPNLVASGHGSGQVITDTFIGASTTAFDSIADLNNKPCGGNWVLDCHCYMMRAASTNTSFDGRDANGINANWSACAANVEMRSQNSGTGTCANGAYNLNIYPPQWAGTTNRTQCQSQIKGYFHPYKLFCDPSHANVPWFNGEWGWQPAVQTGGGGNLYIDDVWAAIKDGGACVSCQWDLQTDATNPWSAWPNRIWQPTTTHWLGLT